MTRQALGIPVLGLLVAACGPPDMSQEEVKKNVFGGKGVVGGHAFGDSWEEIKKNHAEVFEVRDDDFKQLRRNVSDNAGDNGYFIGFGLDDAGKVTSFDISINGSKQNAVVARKLLDDAIAYFDVMIGGGGCAPTPAPDDGNSSNCSWREQPGKPEVSIMYLEMSDPIRGSLQIDINPPKDVAK